MKRRPGVALALVLWVLVVLSTIASAVVIGTRSTVDITANHRAGVVARYAAESGVAVAVATLEHNLATLADSTTRRDYLNALDRALAGNESLVLGDARSAIALVDISSRLDVNLADAPALATLLGFFTSAIEAEDAARAIRAFIDRAAEQNDAAMPLLAFRPLRDLGELLDIPGVPRALAERAAEYLTVDGDGTINRVTAPEPVRAAAGGELRDEPARILVISRGWLDGHPLTHEIQAVYAIGSMGLVLVRWRERDL